MYKKDTYFDLIELVLQNSLETKCLKTPINDLKLLSLKASDVLSLDHTLTNQLFFSQTSNPPNKLIPERIVPLFGVFNNCDELEFDLVRNVSKVVCSIKEKNHLESLNAFLFLHLEDVLLNHLYSEIVVQEIIWEVFIDLSFKNIRSTRNISPSPENQASCENNNKSRLFDIEEDHFNQTNKQFENKFEESLKKAGPTFLSKSQMSISRRSSIGNSKNMFHFNELEKPGKDKPDFRINFINKIIEKLINTKDDRVVENITDLFSDILLKSRNSSNLRILLEEVFYTGKFQEKIDFLLFKSTNTFKFEKMGVFLINLIESHEDYFFIRNGIENPVKLSPPFYRFMNDCIEPLNEILSGVK